MKPVAWVVFLLALYHPLASAQSEDTHGLLLRGKVLKVRTDRSYKGYVDLKLDLSLDFCNEGSAPAIIMRPWHEHDYWHGGSLIATTLQNAQTHKYLLPTACGSRSQATIPISGWHVLLINHGRPNS